MRHSLCAVFVVCAATGCTPDSDSLSNPAILPDAGNIDPVARTVTVSLTFDDTFADQFQLGTMFEKYGMHGTFYVNSIRFGMTGYMTAQQVKELREAGNEIGGHTLHHPHLPAIDPDQARTEICNDRSALLAAGYDVTSFAYPFGDADPMVEQIARECGYNSARDVGGLYAKTSCISCPPAIEMPPGDLFSLSTVKSVGQDSTLDDLKDYVLTAEQHGGGWIPLVFHHICDGCSDIGVSPNIVSDYLDWLYLRGTNVRTVGDMIGGSVHAAVTYP